MRVRIMMAMDAMACCVWIPKISLTPVGFLVLCVIELAIQECVAKGLEERLRWNICMFTVPPCCCCNVEVRLQHV